MREYPLGMEGAPDIDSGPISRGFSGPASVLGAGAAIANGDEALAATLLSITGLVGMPVETDGGRRYAGGHLPVGDAYLAWARSAPVPASSTPYASLVPGWWRMLIHAVSLLLAAAFAGAAAAIVRRYGRAPKLA